MPAWKARCCTIAHPSVSPARLLLCCLQFFDITAGRVSCELSAHRGSITGLDFHPVELVLASSSADQTVRALQAAAMIGCNSLAVVSVVAARRSHRLAYVPFASLLLQARFWSVEGLPPRLLSVSPSIPSPLAACHFVPPQTGSALAAVTSDGVRMLSFNGASSAAAGGAVAPFRTETLDAVDVPLGPAVACTWAGSNLRMGGASAGSSGSAPGSPPVHLLAASLAGSIVSVWSANLSRLAPLAAKALHPAFAGREPAPAPPAAAPAATLSGAGTAAAAAVGSRTAASAGAHSPTRKPVGSPAAAAAAPAAVSPGAADAAAAEAAAPRVRVRVPVPVKSVSLTAAAGDQHDFGNEATRLDVEDADADGHSDYDAAQRRSLQRANAGDAKHDPGVPPARAYAGSAGAAAAASAVSGRVHAAETKAASPQRPAAHIRGANAASAAADDEEGKYSEDDFEIEDEEVDDRDDRDAGRAKQQLPPPPSSVIPQAREIRSSPGTARLPPVEVPMPVPGSVGRLAHSPITALDDDADRGFAPPASAEKAVVSQPAAQPASKPRASPEVPSVNVAAAGAAAAPAAVEAGTQVQLSGRRGAAAAPNLASALAPALAMAEQAAALAAAALAGAPVRRKSLTHRGERIDRGDRESGSGSSSAALAAPAAPLAAPAAAVRDPPSAPPTQQAPKAEPPSAAAVVAHAQQPEKPQQPAASDAAPAARAAPVSTAAADSDRKGKDRGSHPGAAAAAKGSGPAAVAAAKGPAPRPVSVAVSGDGSDGLDGEAALPLVPATRHAPVGLDLAAFLPVNNARGFGASRVLPAASAAAALAASFRNPSSAGGAVKGRPPLPLPAAAYPQQRPSTGEASRGRGRATAAPPERQSSPPPPATEQFADAPGGSPQQCPSRLPAAAAVLRSLQREHGSMLRALRFRLEELAAAASLWAAGDVPASVAVLRVAAHSDPAVGADFLRQFAFERCGGAVGLDAAEALLRLAGAALAAACSSSQPARSLLATAPALAPSAVPSSFDGEAQPAPVASPASAAVAAFAATLRAFGGFIAATMGSAAGAVVAGAATGRDGVGAGDRDGDVGLAAEERAKRCLTALRAFEAVRVDVQAAARMLAALAAAGESGARVEAARAADALQQYESWRSALPLHAVVAAARPSTAAAGGASSGGLPSP